MKMTSLKREAGYRRYKDDILVYVKLNFKITLIFTCKVSKEQGKNVGIYKFRHR